MNLNDTFDVIEYYIKKFINEKQTFNIIEYYALANVEPLEFAKIARQNGRSYLSRWLIMYGQQDVFDSSKISLEQALSFGYKYKDHELTKEEATLIYNTLSTEGYPLKSNVYFQACRRFAKGGLETLLKENIKNELIANYENTFATKGKVRVKTL